MDDIEFICPNCNCKCGLDDSGDLYLLEHSPHIGGLKVHEAAGNDWRTRQYLATEPKQYQPPAHMIAGVAGKAAKPVEPDPALVEANQKDLKKRNLI